MYNIGSKGLYGGVYFLSRIRPQLAQKSEFRLFCKKFQLDSHETYLRSLELLLEECKFLQNNFPLGSQETGYKLIGIDLKVCRK